MRTEKRVTYGPGGFNPHKPNSNVIEEITVEVPDTEAFPVLAIDKTADLAALTAFVTSTDKIVTPETLTTVLRVITGKLIAVAPTEVAAVNAK